MLWDQVPTINADRVCLRAISENDVDALFGIFSDPRVMRYWSTPPLSSRTEAVELLKEINDCFRNESMIKWGVALLSDDSLIGTATLFNFNLESGRAELGYCLGSAYWGKGYINEALNALFSYWFNELNMRRLEADVDPRNEASLRTVDRLGFKFEGHMRERWHVNGEIQDTHFFGLLRREWETQSKNRQDYQDLQDSISKSGAQN
jgi:RimJ/RimL family protein N-acetyltransferase